MLEAEVQAPLAAAAWTGLGVTDTFSAACPK